MTVVLILQANEAELELECQLQDASIYPSICAQLNTWRETGYGNIDVFC